MVDAESYDWTRFEIVFYYDQPLPDVFRSWATAAGLESFFIQRAHFSSANGVERAPMDPIEKGDRYRWDWRQPISLEGEVTKVTLDKELSFTFGSMIVTILFARVQNQSELRLIQTDIADSPEGRVLGHLNCRSCWVFFLTNLKSVLGGGPDLRDEEPDRVSSIEVGFEPLSGKL